MIILNKEEFEIREKLLLTAIKDKNHVNAINDIASFYLQNKFYHKSRIYFKKILKINLGIKNPCFGVKNFKVLFKKKFKKKHFSSIGKNNTSWI